MKKQKEDYKIAGMKLVCSCGYAKEEIDGVIKCPKCRGVMTIVVEPAW